MPKIEWNKSLELGMCKMDKHHKHFAELINKTHDHYTAKANRETLGEILDELIDYSIYHFAAEEYWMRVSSYPKRLEHRKEHDRFSEKTAEIRKAFHSGKTPLSIEILQFLKSWLTNHIRQTDSEFAGFALEHSEEALN